MYTGLRRQKLNFANLKIFIILQYKKDKIRRYEKNKWSI